MSERFIKVRIDSVHIYNMNFIVLLRSSEYEQVLPICIGAAEASSIAMALEGKEPSRPLTHDLLLNVIKGFDCTVDRVHVTDLRSGTFYGRVYFNGADGQTIEHDSRPSDALALAVRCDAPVYVREDVFVENMVQIDDHLPTEGEEQETAPEETKPTPPSDPVTRLQLDLKAAVEEERYEAAAQLRDQIKQIQQEGN